MIPYVLTDTACYRSTAPLPSPTSKGTHLFCLRIEYKTRTASLSAPGDHVGRCAVALAHPVFSYSAGGHHHLCAHREVTIQAQRCLLPGVPPPQNVFLRGLAIVRECLGIRAPLRPQAGHESFLELSGPSDAFMDFMLLETERLHAQAQSSANACHYPIGYAEPELPTPEPPRQLTFLLLVPPYPPSIFLPTFFHTLPLSSTLSFPSSFQSV